MGSKPYEDVLRDVTAVASRLAESATWQLDVALKELRGDFGKAKRSEGAEDSREDPRLVNLGDLATNALHVISKVGEVLVQLSEYDLVRRGKPQLCLRSANPLLSKTYPASKTIEVAFLVENDGAAVEAFALVGSVSGLEPKAPAQAVAAIKPSLDKIDAYERRAISMTLPKLAPGKHLLEVESKGRVQGLQGKVEDRDFGSLKVQLTVLGPPQPHRTRE